MRPGNKGLCNNNSPMMHPAALGCGDGGWKRWGGGGGGNGGMGDGGNGGVEKMEKRR